MRKSILIAAALATAAVAQTPDSKSLAFEVASVKIAAPCCAAGQWRESRAIEDRIDFRYVTLRYCVAFAWRLKEYQVSGPPWINETRYDILAKGPAGTTPDQLPEMARQLLAERFKLEVHGEKKEFNVFVLTAAKSGPKFKESPPRPEGAPSGASFGISNTAAGVGKMECRYTDMAALANTLPRFVGRPVVNQTNLSGRYDFDLEFSPEDMKGIAPPQLDSVRAGAELGVSIFTSIQRIGLKLDSQKLPLDAMVVDAGEKTPIEN